mmetsp:Transcript_17791/g.36923  ORF Transcript_17791/g.36923 Transcript_17791/m.36923 type:complete len:641 (+) Transcript_17791:1254-3176(+)
MERRGGSQRAAARVAPAARSRRPDQRHPQAKPSILRDWARRLVPVFSRYRKLPGWTPNPITALTVLVFIRITSAIHSGIADCDETYNYWEPLHFMLYGFGFQTWENAPEFALRSYAFLLPYASVARLIRSLAPKPKSAVDEKLLVFYGVRVVQGIVSACSEVYLYDSVVWRFGKVSARLLLIFLATAPGMFRASIELLPSSFSMILTTLAVGAWLVGEFPFAIFCVALSTILGWPYAAALALPMAIHIPLRIGLAKFIRHALFAGIPLLSVALVVDSTYYGKFTSGTVNQVLYNVIPKKGTGPEIFGVADWKFYASNLLLNLNVVVPILVSFALLLVIDLYVVRVWKERKYLIERIIFLSPPLIWLLIFFNQPHKEERFLVPSYPLLCLCAAVAVSDWIQFISDLVSGASEVNGERSKRNGGIFAMLLTVGIGILATSMGTSRTVGQVRNFQAPLSIYRSLATEELQGGEGPRHLPLTLSTSVSEINICLGREWYRFPSNFFIPSKKYRVRFVDRSFKGLLPKYFSEGLGGTRKPTSGMNMYNRADPGQFFEGKDDMCHYYVDLAPSSSSVKDHPIDLHDFGLIMEEDFLDSSVTPSLDRAFWIPASVRHPRRRYGKYQLMRNFALIPRSGGPFAQKSNT